MANLKAARSDRFFQSIFALVANQRVQFAFGDVNRGTAHLVFFSRNLKFDAAIRQLRPTPLRRSLWRRRTDTEPDALHTSLVEDLERNHSRCLLNLPVCWMARRPLRIEQRLASSVHLYE